MTRWRHTFPNRRARHHLRRRSARSYAGRLAGCGLPTVAGGESAEDYADYRRNEASAVRPGMQDATGKPARSFSDFAQEYARHFFDGADP